MPSKSSRWSSAGSIAAQALGEDRIGRVIDLASGPSDDDGTPVIEAVREGVHLKFWCAWCRSWHLHGVHNSIRCKDPGCPCPRHPDYLASRGPCLCPRGTGDGPREAHCFRPGSPFRPGGYILREVKS
jgi:hypothetical protein